MSAKKPAFLITVLRDESEILPFFLTHYTKTFDPSDIYVIDDSSHDETLSILAETGVNISTLPVGYDNMIPSRHVAGIMTGLFSQYDVGVFTEADDFMLMADGSPMIDFLKKFAIGEKSFFTTKHVGIMQDIDNEPAIDVSIPWLRQRERIINIKKFDNPWIWKVPPAWSFDHAYHDAYGMKPSTDSEVLSIDLHTIDFDMCNVRHKKRMARGCTGIYRTDTDEDLKTFFRKRCNVNSNYYNHMSSFTIPECIKDVVW